MIQRYLLFMLFLCLQMAARGQTGYDYRYWFDTRSDNAVEGTSQGSAWHIDAALDGLDESLHVVHVQVKDSEGVWSVPVSRCFVKMPVKRETNITYWFDQDYANRRTVAAGNGTVDVDVSALLDGVHVMHVQASTPTSATASGIATCFFVKIPQTLGVDHMTCQMFIDGQLFRTERVAANEGVLAWNLNVASLPQGVHKYHVQVVTPSGAATSTKDGFFVRTTTLSEVNSMKCYYVVDYNPIDIQEATTLGNGVFHFDLDVSEVPTGLHRLAYWLSGGNASTNIHTAFFTKVPNGGNGIVRYEYWVNEGFDSRIIVPVSPQQETLTLQAVVPVDPQPFRSSNFDFHLENGIIALYARNEFHIRFFDADGRVSDFVRSYADINVHETAEPIGELQAQQTFSRVEENQIRWYTVTVEAGDTVTFRSSQGCTIQLFSPQGGVVYEASGSSSRTDGGCRINASGTYYLAVHDVTGNSNSMTLYYTHQEKGDVNGDGRVDISDVTSMVNIILGKATSTGGYGDVNGDGKVDISDVTALVNIILGK